MRHLIILLVLLSLNGYCQTYTVETVPNTKLVNNSYVSNPDGILDEATAAEINSILGSLETQTSAQVAVVAIQSIGDEDIFDFAQKLFKHWGIGHAKEDNGLLILLVMEKRTIRLHTGFGLEGELPDIICKHIEMQKMVPYFKEGDYNTGVLDGVREVFSILTNTEYSSQLKSSLTQDSSDDEQSHNSDPVVPSDFILWPVGIWTVVMLIVFFFNRSQGTFTNSTKFKTPEGPHIKTSSFHFIFWFIIIPVGVMLGTYFLDSYWMLAGGFYGYFFLGSLETQLRINSVYKKYLNQKAFHPLHSFLQEKLSLSLLSAIVVPIPFLFIHSRNKKRLALLREHPRECSQCGKPATKLSERTEDPFLNKQQIFEENIKSVDYDVWKCGDCGAAQVFRYHNRNTKYEECSKCGTVAYYVSSTRTLKAATQSSEGLKEEVRFCKYCKFRNVKTFAIPKVTASSSGGSGGSSGGSWGGGSSGGGGASSSW